VHEAHHRGIVGVDPAERVLPAVVDRLDVQPVEIDIGHFLQAGGVGVEEFFDGVGELVVLDQNGFGAQPGAELNVVDRLMIARVGNPHEQFVAASPEGQGVVLAHQFFADQAFGLGFLVEAVEVEKCHAEMLRGNFRDLPALHQFVLHQVTDQRQAIALRLLPGLLGTLFREQFGLDQLLGQTAQSDVIHGVSTCLPFMTYSLVK